MYYSFAMRLFALYPQVVATATDIDKSRLLREAVRKSDNDEFSLDLMFPISTLDQVQAAFAVERITPCTARLRALVEVQCGPLSLVLNQDVMVMVNEYLFGGFKSVGEPEVADSEFSEARREARWFKAAVQDDDKLMAQLLDEDPTLIDAVNDGEDSASFGGGGYSGRTALHMASYGGCVYSKIVRSLPRIICHVHRMWETAKQVLYQLIAAPLLHRQPQRSLQRGSQSAD